VASDAKNVPTGRSAYRLKSIFESEMKRLEQKLVPVAQEFQKQADLTVKRALTPSLAVGAKKGSTAAVATVESWGSKNRRTKHERNPENNGMFHVNSCLIHLIPYLLCCLTFALSYPGLYWATYQATVTREGVFTSGAAGEVDFNQELYDPMEKEFSTEWQRIMDSSLRTLLAGCETKVTQICISTTRDLTTALRQGGLDASRLSNMVNTASRGCNTALKNSFQEMRGIATEAQRELSRSLLPEIQERMKGGYSSAMSVERGPGVFNRMKDAMTHNAQGAVVSMFDESMRNVLSSISDLINRLSSLISATSSIISKSLETVFSICWDSQSDKSTLMDPAVQQKIRDCRDALLPELNRLLETQNEASKLLGIEREELELDVLQVESFEDSLKRKQTEAEKKGDAFDLCDSDAEIDVQPAAKVKAESSSQSSPGRRSAIMARCEAVIDLCDSDDDWQPPPPSRLSQSPRKNRVKDEPDWID
jgi:hypothetical protein